MSEPIILKVNTKQVLIHTNEVSDSTALRELADWIDEQGGEWIVLSVSSHSSINYGGARLTEDSCLAALVEKVGGNHV